jgi:hypothetical protein
METLAWTSAMGGLLLGGLASFVPGFPGCAVALLGLVAFAGLTDFEVVTAPALIVAAGITVAGAFGQVTGPVVAGRAAGGSAGVATGAAVGAAVGAIVPVPGAAWFCAVSGALVLGVVLSRRQWIAWLRGVVGTAGGCLVGWAADLVAVLAIGAVLGLADFLHATAGS